jgi:hypothetical protein
MKVLVGWTDPRWEIRNSGYWSRLMQTSPELDRGVKFKFRTGGEFLWVLSLQSEHTLPVHGEFVLMQPLAFGIDRDGVSASGTI